MAFLAGIGSVKLNKAVTNDRSTPSVAGVVLDAPSSLSLAAPARPPPPPSAARAADSDDDEAPPRPQLGGLFAGGMPTLKKTGAGGGGGGSGASRPLCHDARDGPTADRLAPSLPSFLAGFVQELHRHPLLARLRHQEALRRLQHLLPPRLGRRRRRQADQGASAPYTRRSMPSKPR